MLQRMATMFTNNWNYFAFSLRLGRNLSTKSVQKALRALSHPISHQVPKYTSAEQAVDAIKSGSSIHLQSFSSTPTELMEAVCDRVKIGELTDIRFNHSYLNGPIPWHDPKCYGKVRSNCSFMCDEIRNMVKEGLADYMPIFLSAIPRLYSQFVLPVDVAFTTVSPPDQHGFCSIGINVEGTYDALKVAKSIIALENPNMPRTFGDTVIHVSHFDAIVQSKRDVYSTDDEETEIGEAEMKVGQLIAEELVDDGSTVQIGFGTIPDAAALALVNHRNLGVHTELIGDWLFDLIEKNVINNLEKTVDPGKVVTSLCNGSKKFYKFVDNNSTIWFRTSEYSNNPSVIARQHKMVSINAAIEVDLTGQIVAESIGKTLFSGFGGHVDFVSGAGFTVDGLGKSIIAMTSLTKKGNSKIVPLLKEGSGVVTTRGHVRYIATEYGIAQLWGKNVRQRACELIRIAHPNQREMLEKAFFERFRCMPSRD